MTGVDITDRGSPSDAAELRDRLHEYNFDATGYRDGRSLSCFLRDVDGQLIAGLDGFTWGGYAKTSSSAALSKRRPSPSPRCLEATHRYSRAAVSSPAWTPTRSRHRTSTASTGTKRLASSTTRPSATASTSSRSVSIAECQRSPTPAAFSNASFGFSGSSCSGSASSRTVGPTLSASGASLSRSKS